MAVDYVVLKQLPQYRSVRQIGIDFICLFLQILIFDSK